MKRETARPPLHGRGGHRVARGGESRLLTAPRFGPAAAVAFGSWALWPVYDSSCVVCPGFYVPMNAPKAEVDAAAQRRYDKALADGACGPERACFHNWTR
ncbi:hypothetical protein GCM10010493_75080 [Streptomyces lavendulae subsp. grasserius]